jgi:hypothetical protein
METADLVWFSMLQRKVSVDSYPRFKAFCRVVDALRVTELPGTAEVDRGNFLRKLVAAGLQDVPVKEIRECFRIYLTLYDERIALVDGLADILVRYGANTIYE